MLVASIEREVYHRVREKGDYGCERMGRRLKSALRALRRHEVY
jgi:DNA-binding HxlR family transcriptional regulator